MAARARFSTIHQTYYTPAAAAAAAAAVSPHRRLTAFSKFKRDLTHKTENDARARPIPIEVTALTDIGVRMSSPLPTPIVDWALSQWPEQNHIDQWRSSLSMQGHPALALPMINLQRKGGSN